MKRDSVKNMILTGVFAGIISLLALIPTGISIMGVNATFQTMAIAFTGYVLGAGKGALSAFVYMIMGLMLPVYSNGTAGFGVLFGPSGGFIFGFIFLAAFCGYAWNKQRILWKIVISLAGLFFCHFLGTLQFMLISDMDMWQAFTVISLSYIPKDIISVGLAYMVAQPVRRSIKNIM